MSDLLTSMKRASQRFAGAVADTGAKTMLKVRAYVLVYAFWLCVFIISSSGMRREDVRRVGACA